MVDTRSRKRKSIIEDIDSTNKPNNTTTQKKKAKPSSKNKDNKKKKKKKDAQLNKNIRRSKRNRYTGSCKCTIISACSASGTGAGICQNRARYINCSEDNCHFMKLQKKSCSNHYRKTLSHGVAKCIMIRYQGGKNIGLRAVYPIKIGDYLGEYTGTFQEKSCCNYCVDISTQCGEDGEDDENVGQPTGVICGRENANTLKYVNHSCSPNVEMVIRVNIKAKPVVLFQAIKNINPGDEVTVSYQGTQFMESLKADYESVEKGQRNDRSEKLNDLYEEAYSFAHGKNGLGFVCECGSENCIIKWVEDRKLLNATISNKEVKVRVIPVSDGSYPDQEVDFSSPGAFAEYGKTLTSNKCGVRCPEDKCAEGTQKISQKQRINKEQNAMVCPPLSGSSRGICMFIGCTYKAQHSSRCMKHGAEVTTSKSMVCEYEGCTKWVVNSGLCLRHGAKRRICKREGCEKLQQNKGFCKRRE